MGIFKNKNQTIESLIDACENISEEDIYKYLVLKDGKEPKPIIRLKKMGDDSVPALIEAIDKGIDSNHTLLLVNSIYTLCLIGTKAVILVLTGIMKRDLYTIMSARTKISEIPVIVAFDPFEMLYDKIVQTLFRFKNPEIIESIKAIAADKQKVNVKPYAIKFLGELVDPDYIPLFIECMGDLNVDTGQTVRTEALSALLKLSKKKYLQRIIKAITQKGDTGIQNLINSLVAKEPESRILILNILQKLEAKDAICAIALLMLDESTIVARKAASLVALFEGKDTKDYLITLFNLKKSWNFKERKGENKYLFDHVSDTEINQHVILAEYYRNSLLDPQKKRTPAYKNLKSAYIKKLVVFMLDEDDDRAERAWEYLKKQKFNISEVVIYILSIHINPYFQTNLDINSGIEYKFYARESNAVYIAAKRLGWMKCKSALPVLSRALDDEESSVRRYADSAIDMIKSA
jgi:hypothetical protein